MKFFTVKNAEVSEGVKATIVFHKDSGAELICVYEGWEAFLKKNKKAKELDHEKVKKLLKKEKLRVPRRKKRIRRRKKRLKQEEIQAEIENKETPTVNITEESSEDGQILTYYEEQEIASVEDFVRYQKHLHDVPPIEEAEEEAETTTI